MSKIRVAHIITRLCKGGAQENTFHTVRLHNKERYDVDLICGTNTGDEGTLEPELEAAGITIIREPNLVRDITSPLQEFKALRGLTRRLKHGNYDIVHTHTSKAGFLGRLAAHKAKVPIVIHTPHGNIFDGYFSPAKTMLYTALERKAARWTNRIIELTDGGIEEYLAQGIGSRDLYTTIFSGIDLSPYENRVADRARIRAELGVDAHTFLVGGVGRLEKIKGFAAEQLHKSHPKIQFVHAGTGSLEEKFKEFAAPLGERFKFLGLRHDIPSIMAALDVLVVPSVNEGMGRVVLEAGAAGTPCIAANVGGLPEVVLDGQTGIIVPSRDPKAIAEAIKRLVDAPERLKAYADAAKDFVVPDFSLENMVQLIEQLYETLIKEKNLESRR
jgi:glycosyltransferase involved in cell wall biosynthesis